MMIKTQQTMGECTTLSQISAEKALYLDLKFSRSSGRHRADEGESDYGCDPVDIPIKRKYLSFQLPPIEPVVGKLQVSFEKINTDCSENSEPTPKRRRFQRRNSKTAKMLSMSMPSFLALELSEKKQNPSSPEYDEDIDIAEDLVRHFRASRQRQTVQPMAISVAKS